MFLAFGLHRPAWFHPGNLMRRVVHFLSSAPLCQSAFSLPHLLFYCSEEVGSLCLYENKSEVSGRCCFLQIECKIFFFLSEMPSHSLLNDGKAVWVASTTLPVRWPALLFCGPEGDSTDSVRFRCQKMGAIGRVERREG